MAWRSTTLVFLLAGSLFVQFTFVRSGPVPNPKSDGTRKLSSNIRSKDDTENSDFIVGAFSNILLGMLLDNDALTSLFLNPVDEELGAYLATAISDSLVLEVGLADSNSSVNLIVDAFLNVAPDAGPGEYCTVLVNILSKILLSNKIINSENYFTLANTINGIIFDIASLNELSNGNKVRKDAAFDLDVLNTNDIGINAAAGLNVKTNTDSIKKTNDGINLGSDIGNNVFDPKLDAANVNSRNNILFNTNSNLNANAGINSVLDADANIGLTPRTNFGLNLGSDIGSNVLDPRLEASNIDSRNNVGLNISPNLNSNIGINPVLGVDASIDLSPGTNLNSIDDSGTNNVLKISEEANLKFRSELINILLKDRNFRYIFSDYIPSNALKQISAAICQYISKAFAIPRSFLLPLENSIGNLSFDSTPYPEQYANIITGLLTNLFGNANFITKDTASLQANIAATAIISGIANFINISTIPGAGLSISENAFNSYFSILNGLEKLPYIGVEAASSKLPLSVKLTYASMYASQFAKILFSNLMSSSKFLEMFSLNAPIFNRIIIAKSLGYYVSEAFGSPNLILFYDLYSKSLLSPRVNFNSVNFAKVVSSATAKALFLSGYFLSGNINIQSAIAKNAIIRALSTKLGPVSTQVILFPNILGLPWMTQLEGASSSQIFLKYGTDVGANSGFGLGLNGNVNTNINAALGAGINANAALGTGVNVNSGLGTDLGVNIGLGSGLDANIGLGSGLGTNTNLDIDLGRVRGLNVDLGAGLNANIDLGRGITSNSGIELDSVATSGLQTGNIINSNLGTGLGLNVGLGGILSTNNYLDSGLGGKVGLGGSLITNTGFGRVLDGNIGLGGGLGANVNLGGLGTSAVLGGGVGTNVGLGGGLGTNVGLGGGLSTNVGLGGGLGSNAALGIGTNTNIGSIGGLDTNVGLGAGLDANVGLGGIYNVNNGLGTGLGINSALGANIGSNAGFGTLLNSNVGLGTATGVNTGLEAVTGINTNLGTGINTGLGAGLNVNTGLGANLYANGGLGTNFGSGENVNLGGLTFQDLGTVAMQGNLQNEQFKFSRKKRSIDDSDTAPRTTGLGALFGTGEDVSVTADADLGLNSGNVLGAGFDAGLGISDNSGLFSSLRADERTGIGANLDTKLGVDTTFNTGINQGAALSFAGSNLGLQSTMKGNNPNTLLSILNVLPLILANKLYQSTALYTSVSMVGAPKIINLISQAMTSEFGLPIALVFLRSFNQFFINNSEKSFEIIVVGLAKSTTEALAGTGFLSSRTSIATANQLADAIVSKFSSLIATSLDAKDCATTPKWTYLLSQDLVQPPLVSGYNTYSTSVMNSLLK